MMTVTLSLNDATIPAELKALPHWVCWKAKPNGERIEKIPVCASTGSLASSTDPETWTTYEQAKQVAETQDGLGIGFVFQRDAGIVGIDLDKCRDASTGVVEPWAEVILRGLNSYTEVSPSGTGVHIYVRGVLPPGRRKKGRIEAYESGRFFTVTGQHVGDTPATVEARPEQLAVFHAAHLADPVPERPAQPVTRTTTLGDVDIVDKCRKAKNGGKFNGLWRGHTAGYASQSEADLALIGLLKFYTQDAGQLDRLFRQSGLMRPKWDERRGDQTYGEQTIAEALAYVRETYYPFTHTGMKEPIPMNTVTAETEESAPSGDDDTVPTPLDALGPFPEDAWRGPFKVYREAMQGTSEAPDTAHFTALWAVAAATLRRRVSFYYAFPHFPNVYLVNFGNTGDSKTSAGRQGLRLLPEQGVKLLRGVGSAEALGDWMQQPVEGPMVSHLLFIEELATVLSRGGWEGSTLLSFLTETFDTPEKYEIPFRKNPVLVQEPTPTLIAGTTIEWLWKGLREIDVHGGFGNRIFYMTGPPKPPVPLPTKPNQEALAEVRGHLQRLATLPPTELFFMPEAQALWRDFYLAWKGTSWPELTTAATKRIPTYIVKLSMVYAALEGTSLITADQVAAAIQVGHYGARCADLLMNRHRQQGVQSKCEARVLAALRERPLPAWKIHRAISGSYSAEELARALRALQAAGAIVDTGTTLRHEPIYGRRNHGREV